MSIMEDVQYRGACHGKCGEISEYRAGDILCTVGDVQ